VDGLMDGAMYNAGQCCCGIERIYVHESPLRRFVEKAVAWVGQLKLGNPFDADHAWPDGEQAASPKTVRDQTAEAIAARARSP
jgi:acyl-CoA reductase-like NAD-dependent aldehyde dehydrogenase